MHRFLISNLLMLSAACKITSRIALHSKLASANNPASRNSVQDWYAVDRVSNQVNMPHNAKQTRLKRNVGSYFYELFLKGKVRVRAILNLVKFIFIFLGAIKVFLPLGLSIRFPLRIPLSL